MRSEQEMYKLIVDVARDDWRIKAVYINGSRANPKIKKDIFQDYDIVYVITETASFIQDKGWTSIFGERIVSQEPDDIDRLLGKEIDFTKGYTYLMQFIDGNRIDLHLLPLDKLEEAYGKDKLTVVLLDKDNYLVPVPAPSDEDYWVRKPTYEEYSSRCNEFWWVAPYCAKGLWRHEMLYTIEMLNTCVREELLNMLDWQVGIQTDFKVSVGKSHKYLKDYIEDETWERLLTTFNMGNEESTWQALITTCELFEIAATKVARELQYEYNDEEAGRSFDFIKHIRMLPENATDIY